MRLLPRRPFGGSLPLLGAVRAEPPTSPKGRSAIRARPDVDRANCGAGEHLTDGVVFLHGLQRLAADLPR